MFVKFQNERLRPIRKSNRGILVYTLTDELFFDVPNIDARRMKHSFDPEGFSYRLHSFDEDGFLVARSRVVYFPIHVQLVNHRPMLAPPNKIVPSGKTGGERRTPNIALLNMAQVFKQTVPKKEKGSESKKRVNLSVNESKTGRCKRNSDRSGRISGILTEAEGYEREKQFGGIKVTVSELEKLGQIT